MASRAAQTSLSARRDPPRPTARAARRGRPATPTMSATAVSGAQSEYWAFGRSATVRRKTPTATAQAPRVDSALRGPGSRRAPRRWASLREGAEAFGVEAARLVAVAEPPLSLEDAGPERLTPPCFWAPVFWAPVFWAPVFWVPVFWAPAFWAVPFRVCCLPPPWLTGACFAEPDLGRGGKPDGGGEPWADGRRGRGLDAEVSDALSPFFCLPGPSVIQSPQIGLPSPSEPGVAPRALMARASYRAEPGPTGPRPPPAGRRRP